MFNVDNSKIKVGNSKIKVDYSKKKFKKKDGPNALPYLTLLHFESLCFASTSTSSLYVHVCISFDKSTETNTCPE